MAGNTRASLVASLASLAAMSVLAAGPTAAADDERGLEFFEKKIRPLLVENCHTCHSAETNSRGGLRVDDRNGLVTGGEHGPAIVPGKPAESRLLRAVSYTDEDLKMPPKKQLSAEQVADLEKWIAEGAPWPAAELPADIGQSNPEYERLRKEHWAWQPVRDAAPPAVRDAAWPRDEVDAFLLARLEENNLRPVGDASRLALVRRVTFDLTGLPPTTAEIDGFLADTSIDAFEKVVDRLLASPAFGERWGRHWLDVARYGESTGSSRNLPYPHAWRYRDWVIAAVNDDKPYDQFVREQIAGDLLPAASQDERDGQRVATGFLALGVKDVNQRFKVRFVMDNIDEQIDAVSRAFLAVTASCARCHDHKFDPIPTSDYYALAGIFHSTELCAGVRNKMGGGGLDYYDTKMLVALGGQSETFEPDPAMAKEIEAQKKALAEARAEFEALRGKPEGNEPGSDGRPKRAIAREKMNRLQNALQGLADPASHGTVALGVRDAAAVGDTEIRIRGEAEKMGPRVPRGFLSVARFEGQPAIDPAHSGRLELAEWLTDRKNPLVARVMVNRVWRHLFGRGLVSSVDNFGVTGAAPSHPELLDYLAARFVRDGWSVKRLIRGLVLTRAYGLGSEEIEQNRAVDPDNRLVWRHAPRRLEAEELRDAVLAAADMLDPAPGEGSPAGKLRVVELSDTSAEARRIVAAAIASRHRSIYLPLVRGITPRSLEVFDFAEQGMVTGSRDTTTVATQALYLLNDSFIRRQALALAERLLARDAIDDAERINWAYRLTLRARPLRRRSNGPCVTCPTTNNPAARRSRGCWLRARRRPTRWRLPRATSQRPRRQRPRGRWMPQATSSRTARSRTRRSPPPKAKRRWRPMMSRTSRFSPRRRGRPPGPAFARRCSGRPSFVICRDAQVETFANRSPRSVEDVRPPAAASVARPSLAPPGAQERQRRIRLPGAGWTVGRRGETGAGRQRHAARGLGAAAAPFSGQGQADHLPVHAGRHLASRHLGVQAQAAGQRRPGRAGRRDARGLEVQVRPARPDGHLGLGAVSAYGRARRQALLPPRLAHRHAGPSRGRDATAHRHVDRVADAALDGRVAVVRAGQREPGPAGLHHDQPAAEFWRRGQLWQRVPAGPLPGDAAERHRLSAEPQAATARRCSANSSTWCRP